jgi:hypothetical protein
VAELLAGSGDTLVQVEGDVPSFVARLRARGLTVEDRAGELAVRPTGDATFDAIRDAAAEGGVLLRGLRVETRSLEELYIRQLGGEERETAGVR